MLRTHSRSDVMPQQNQFTGSISFQLQHLNRITQIKMKYLVASQPVQTGERIRGQQIIDSCRDCSAIGIARRQRLFLQTESGSVRLHEIPALDGMRLELQQVAD